jgi:hypothetical protein
MHADRVELVESARYFRRPLCQNICAMGLKDHHGECDLGTTNNAFAPLRDYLKRTSPPSKQPQENKQI